MISLIAAIGEREERFGLPERFQEAILKLKTASSNVVLERSWKEQGGKVWAKAGSMVSYRGRVKFKREGVFEHGIGRMVKKVFSGEGAALMKAEGNGKVYLADQGKKISILQKEAYFHEALESAERENIEKAHALAGEWLRSC